MTPNPKLDAAIVAVTDLIAATLASGDPGRFSIVTRLCGTAHTLALETATRVGDFAVSDGNNAGPQMVHNPVRFRGGMNDTDLTREAMATVLPYMDIAAAHYRAQTEAAEATTLETLLAVRERVPPGHVESVNTRIATLLTRIKERNDAAVPAVNAVVPVTVNRAADADAVHVVPSDVLRGHPAGADGDGLRADPRADHARGAEGGGGAPQTRPVEAVAQDAVGYR